MIAVLVTILDTSSDALSAEGGALSAADARHGGELRRDLPGCSQFWIGNGQHSFFFIFLERRVFFLVVVVVVGVKFCFELFCL